MGKYIRKSKINTESIALMDIPPSSLGVLTRAKSLALQRGLQKPTSFSSVPTPIPPSKITDCSGGSYLQLRSRRLHKIPPPVVVIRSSNQRRRRKETYGLNPNPNPQILDLSLTDSIIGSKQKMGLIVENESNRESNKDPCFDTSSSENFLELEEEDSERFNRATRKSTPIKPETTTSPGSSTKLNNCMSETNQREEGSLLVRHSHIPTTHEMDQFFSVPEVEQQKQFIDKYNFDPVNEQPLPGRYEWKKVIDD